MLAAATQEQVEEAAALTPELAEQARAAEEAARREDRRHLIGDAIDTGVVAKFKSATTSLIVDGALLKVGRLLKLHHFLTSR